jgi:16S rRNA (uracil1498-N3)-methyltransferase
VRLHRFIVEGDLTGSIITVHDVALLKQWSKVLRLESHDRVILCDGKCTECEATLERIDHTHATLSLQSPRPVTAEPERCITLYCSVLKRENFEWVVQKCTEIGVKEIVPIIAERTVKTGLKVERLRLIAKEAAEQSGRGMIPKITEPMNFPSALLKAKNHASNVMFHTGTSGSGQQKASNSLGLWIGPEGGWTEKELQEAQEQGFTMGSLGMLTLRAETAAVVGVFGTMNQ